MIDNDHWLMRKKNRKVMKDFQLSTLYPGKELEERAGRVGIFMNLVVEFVEL